MKLRRYKTLAVSGLVIAATALTSATALAADVNINGLLLKGGSISINLFLTGSPGHRGNTGDALY